MFELDFWKLATHTHKNDVLDSRNLNWQNMRPHLNVHCLLFTCLVIGTILDLLHKNCVSIATIIWWMLQCCGRHSKFNVAYTKQCLFTCHHNEKSMEAMLGIPKKKHCDIPLQFIFFIQICILIRVKFLGNRIYDCTDSCNVLEQVCVCLSICSYHVIPIV